MTQPSPSLKAPTPRTRQRKRAEVRFRRYGIAAIATGVVFLIVLLVNIVTAGLPAFTQTYITLQVELLESKLDKKGNRDIEDIKKVTTFGFNPLLAAAVQRAIADTGAQTQITKSKALRQILSSGAAGQIRAAVLEDLSLIGQTVAFRFLTPLPVSMGI